MLVLLTTVVLLAAPAKPAIERKHHAGQAYRLSYTSTDGSFGTSKTFKARATVLKASEKSTRFLVTVSELSWTNEKKETRTAANVRLQVDVSEDSVDAEVIDPGTAGAAAEMELTSFERMLGNFCQPPRAKWVVGKAQKLEGASWTMSSVEGEVAKLKATPEADGSPFSCEISVSLADGYAGTRAQAMKILGVPNAELRGTLKIELEK